MCPGFGLQSSAFRLAIVFYNSLSVALRIFSDEGEDCTDLGLSTNTVVGRDYASMGLLNTDFPKRFYCTYKNLTQIYISLII